MSSIWGTVKSCSVAAPDWLIMSTSRVANVQTLWDEKGAREGRRCWETANSKIHLINNGANKLSPVMALGQRGCCTKQTVPSVKLNIFLEFCRILHTLLVPRTHLLSVRPVCHRYLLTAVGANEANCKRHLLLVRAVGKWTAITTASSLF